MIVSAAIKYYLYPDDDTGREVVLPLHRHGDGGKILKTLGFEPSDFKIIEQGFLTDKDEFLERYDALKHAYECGQLRKYDPWELKSILDSEVLMSEDLW